MLASLPVMWWTRDGAARRYDLGKVRIGLVLATLFGAAFVGLRIVELLVSLNVKWDTNAYGSAQWLVLGTHGTLLLVELVEIGGMTLIFWLAPVEEKHFSDVADMVFYWYFMVLAWTAALRARASGCRRWICSEPRRAPFATRRAQDPGRARPRRSGSGLFLAPAAFFAHLQINYVLVPWACVRNGRLWVHVVDVLAVAARRARHRRRRGACGRAPDRTGAGRGRGIACRAHDSWAWSVRASAA